MSNILEKAVFEKSGVPVLNSVLDMASVRNKLISGNLANVITPGYRSKDIDFHGELRQALGKEKHIEGAVTHPAHIPVGRSRTRGPEIKVNRLPESNGINNVDIDTEAANLAQNQLYFTAGARLMAAKFQGLKDAIKSK